MNTESATIDSFEIGPRFRHTLEERIAHLERDAAWDEQMLATLTDEDHLRRHRRLIAVQRIEALRMRLFLDRSRARLPKPLIAL
jgi:uncharacterized coiled-coil protein SlyX